MYRAIWLFVTHVIFGVCENWKLCPTRDQYERCGSRIDNSAAINVVDREKEENPSKGGRFGHINQKKTS